MHTRAHSPIHIQLWVNQTNQAATAATTKNHNFHFLCVARLPQWRLHYNLKFDQIRISHSDLLHHKWKCWKLIVDRVAMQLAYQNENVLLSSSATFFFLFLVFHHNKSSCPREHIANLSQFFSVAVSKLIYIYVSCSGYCMLFFSEWDDIVYRCSTSIDCMMFAIN